MIPNCIHRTNPTGGFVSQHGRFCAACDNDATTHLHVGGWCGNMCAEHGKALKQQRGTAAELTTEVYIAEDDLAAEYNLKQLRVRKLGSARTHFGKDNNSE